MRGRNVGTRFLTMDQIEEIVELTEKNVSRTRIANSVGCSKDTVWRYQKKLNLI